MSWKTLISVLTLAVPFQSIQPGQIVLAAEESNPLQSAVQTIKLDLSRLARLTDTLNKKIEAQDPAACAGGNELDLFITALQKINADYDLLKRTVVSASPELQVRVQEHAQNASEIVSYVSETALRASCKPAATGRSAKAIAHMSITLQVTLNDVDAQILKANELEKETTSQLPAVASTN